MTTVEAIQQCLHNTRVEDLSNVSAQDGQILIRALNQACQDYFDWAPAGHKRTSASYYLAAPETVTNINLTTGATNVSSGTPFSTSHRGCSIQIHGDPNINEVVSTSAVLRPYLGTEAAPLTAQLWHDALPLLDFAIERIVTHPRLTNRTVTNAVLLPWNSEASEHSGLLWQSLVNSPGTPLYYRAEFVGGSIQSENDALVIIRIAPRPEVACALTFDLDLRGTSYSVTALNDPQVLPISRTRANHLLPLIELRLSRTQLWIGSPQITAGIREEAQEARRLIESLPVSFTNPIRHAGTRPGW